MWICFFRDVLCQGLSDPLVLPGSDNYDSILCALVADLDFDGQNEILLGSYGQVCTKEVLNAVPIFADKLKTNVHQYLLWYTGKEDWNVNDFLQILWTLVG